MPKLNNQTPLSNVLTLYYHNQFLRFCFVGALGFVINAVLLRLFHKQFGLPLLAAQAIASEIALFHNFVWHNKWTYAETAVNKSVKLLVIEFHATSWVGIIASSLSVAGLVRYAHMGDFAALAISSVGLLIWNFVMTKFVVWRKSTSPTVITEATQ